MCWPGAKGFKTYKFDSSSKKKKPIMGRSKKILKDTQNQYLKWAGGVYETHSADMFRGEGADILEQQAFGVAKIIQ